MKRMRALVPTLLLLALVIGGIELLLRALGVPHYVFPTPSQIWQAVVNDPYGMATAWSLTVAEALIGLGVAMMVSAALAGAAVILPGTVARVINNIGIAVQSTPLLAIAPLLSLWLGQSVAAKAAAAAIVCFFPLLTGWLTGIRAVTPEHLQLFDNLNANVIQRARFLLIPMALPYFFSGLRVATPLALLGAIVGEFVGASEGIGFRILSNSYYVRTGPMFAYVILAAVTGWIFSVAIIQLEKRLLFWHGQTRMA